MSVETDYSFDRGLPASPECERSILGAILLDNNLQNEALCTLKAEHFFLDAHRRIYQRICDLSETNRPIDIVTLTEELLRHKELEATGGAGYLASLTDGIPRRSSIEHYVRIVRDKAILRNLIHASNGVISQALEQASTAAEVIDAAESSIFNISDSRDGTQLYDISQIAQESFGGDLQKLFQRGGRITGVETYYSDLDNLTSGLQKSDLVIIAGRPSMGKTAFAINIAENVGIKGEKAVAVFSLEMSKEALLNRMMCSQALVNGHKMRTGFLGREDMLRLQVALERLESSNIRIDDTPSISLMELRAKARRMAMDKTGLDLIVIDYLQLMSATAMGGRRYENRTQEVSAISRGLKAIAKELKVPVVALSQLNRATETRGSDSEPKLSDLRESGSIEQDADIVMFLYRPEVYDRDNPELEGIAKLIIAKQRNGPIDTVQFVFNKGATRFDSLDRGSWLTSDSQSRSRGRRGASGALDGM
jgi:replicative DNA helicase